MNLGSWRFEASCYPQRPEIVRSLGFILMRFHYGFYLWDWHADVFLWWIKCGVSLYGPINPDYRKECAP